MSMLLIPTLLLTIAWAVAEFRNVRVVRRVLGFALAALLIGSVSYQRFARRMSANWEFTCAANELLEASTEQLQHRRHDVVLREWAKASRSFGATYENHGRFREVV